MYHVNPKTGNPGACTAEKQGCPYGNADMHFETKDQAAQFYEDSMQAQTFQSLKKQGKLTPKLRRDYTFMMTRRALREIQDDVMETADSLVQLLPANAISSVSDKQAEAWGKRAVKAVPAIGVALRVAVTKMGAWIPFGAVGATVGAGVVAVGTAVGLGVVGKRAFSEQRELLLRNAEPTDAVAAMLADYRGKKTVAAPETPEADPVKPEPVKAKPRKLTKEESLRQTLRMMGHDVPEPPSAEETAERERRLKALQNMTPEEEARLNENAARALERTALVARERPKKK